jgi:hypothetical protein
MQRILLLVVLIGTLTTPCRAQRAQRMMIGIQTDLIKSDNDGFFEKIQGGIEGSFYFSRKVAVTGALEWWSENETVLVIGGRLCPIDEAFIRVRGLIGDDLSIGGGFAKPLSENLRLEAMADFYFRGHIAIRAGIAHGIGRRL